MQIYVEPIYGGNNILCNIPQLCDRTCSVRKVIPRIELASVSFPASVSFSFRIFTLAIPSLYIYRDLCLAIAIISCT
jgi:hypothetical protein